MGLTPTAALENWQVCFEEGRYTTARKWWFIYWKLVTA